MHKAIFSLISTILNWKKMETFCNSISSPWMSLLFEKCFLPFIRSGMEYIGPQGQRKDSEFDGMLMVIVYVTSYSRWRGLSLLRLLRFFCRCLNPVHNLIPYQPSFS